MKVEVVFIGEYADTQAICVCSEGRGHELAERIREVDSTVEVEEFELDELAERFKENLHYRVNVPGDNPDMSSAGLDIGKFGEKANIYASLHSSWLIYYCDAKDSQEAVAKGKALRERLIAENRWIQGEVQL